MSCLVARETTKFKHSMSQTVICCYLYPAVTRRRAVIEIEVALKKSIHKKSIHFHSLPPPSLFLAISLPSEERLNHLTVVFFFDSIWRKEFRVSLLIILKSVLRKLYFISS